MTMTLTQAITFNLNKGTTNEELADDEKHTSLLDALRRTEGAGCNCITWSITEEEPTNLIWLIEWKNPADEAMQDQRQQTLKLFHSHLLANPNLSIISDHSYVLDSSPSSLLSTSRTVLEVFQYYLNKDATFEAHQGVMKPVTDHWKAEGRPCAVGPATSTSIFPKDVNAKNDTEDNAEKEEEAEKSEEDEERNCIFVVPWVSREEHMLALEEEYFREAIKIGGTMQTCKLFVHVRPLR